VEVAQLEADLDEFIRQFLTDYQIANQRARSLRQQRASSEVAPQSTPPAVFAIDDAAHSTAGLIDLPLSSVQLTVLAGRSTAALRTRASQQLIEAGLPVSPVRGGESPITLSIEFEQAPLKAHCPGYVLYSRGLYLVEEVRIARNPRVSLWSDTWLRDTVQIVPPVSIRQLESDQDALLQEFVGAVRQK